ncbi:Hypothetical protein, putative [Bodo saltans]|uniref:Uncharacterized protein n=1 Tax=Bodo saltans TaxID=75058 RepID=A0A0S4JPH6_BODSA|nr:Hypothetical protein, putative [Bodo saltans]|eukprot:CUG92144.1 Hypothetical protein, putative [Bodo saltans]
MQSDDEWAQDIFRTLGARYHRAIRRPHPDWVTNSSSSNSRGTNHSDNTTLLSMSIDGTVAYQTDSRLMSGEFSANTAEPLDYSCMLPPALRNQSAPKRSGQPLQSSSLIGGEQNDPTEEEPWLPVCFYAQMLGTTETHHSVSHPNSPTNASPPKGRNFDEGSDGRRWKERLSTHARLVRSANIREELEAKMFSGVEERATTCASELQEMILAVRRWNAVALDAQRQLKVSRAIDIPRVN